MAVDSTIPTPVGRRWQTTVKVGRQLSSLIQRPFGIFDADLRAVEWVFPSTEVRQGSAYGESWHRLIHEITLPGGSISLQEMAGFEDIAIHSLDAAGETSLRIVCSADLDTNTERLSALRTALLEAAKADQRLEALRARASRMHDNFVRAVGVTEALSQASRDEKQATCGDLAGRLVTYVIGETEFTHGIICIPGIGQGPHHKPIVGSIGWDNDTSAWGCFASTVADTPDLTTSQWLHVSDFKGCLLKAMRTVGLEWAYVSPLGARVEGSPLGLLILSARGPDLKRKITDFDLEAVKVITRVGMGVLAPAASQEFLSKAKDEILDTLSHELRTPLARIRDSSTKLLKTESYGPLSEVQMGISQRILRSSLNALEMVEMMLELARLNAGRVPYNPTEIRPGRTVDLVFEELQTQAQERGVSLTLLSRSAMTVREDENYLRMVLRNLVSNAIKYTPAGGEVSVDISQNGAHWHMTVSDTGIGISQAAQELIFDPFYRAIDPARETQPGAGIGLTLVKQSIETMDGDVFLKSTVGKGSVFTVKLPLRRGG